MEDEDTKHKEGPGCIPTFLKSTLDILRLKIFTASSEADLIRTETLNIQAGFALLNKIKKSCWEEELSLLCSPAPAGLPSHVREVLTKEWLGGETPHWKSPALFRKLARAINFVAHNYSDRPTSPWYNGFDHLGTQPPLGLFPNARSLTEEEKFVLDNFPELDVEALNKSVEVKTPDYLEKEDPTCLADGFAHWKKVLFDGVRLKDCPSDDKSFGTFSFYAPTKWDEKTKKFGKIRLIINDRPRNTLFNPTSEHIELSGHIRLKEIISYCLNRNYDSTWKATKNAIQHSLRIERKRKQTLAATWKDFPPKPSTCDMDPQGFIPCLGKTDISNAYYQIPISRYWLNKIFIPSPNGWIPKFSAVLTFGNRKSVSAFQGFSEFICRVISHFLQIPVIAYLDDYIIFAPASLGVLYHQAVVKLLGSLGITVTTKPSGSFPPALNFVADILGLDYVTLEDAVVISASSNRVLKIKREVADFASKLLMTTSNFAENALQKIYGQISFITSNRTYAQEGPLLALLNPILNADPGSWSPPQRAQVAFFLSKAAARLENRTCAKICRISSAAPMWYIYSDAMATRKNFGLAWVLHMPAKAIFWSWRGSRDELGSFKKLNIFELEVLAALAGLLMIRPYMSGPVNIHLKVDNMGAAHAIPRGGSSKSPSVCVFVDKIFEIALALQLRLLVTYISTKRNLSDEPSRLGTLKDSVPHGITLTDCTEDLSPHLSDLAEVRASYDRRAAYIRGRSKPDPDLQKPLASSTKKCPVGRSNFSVRKDITAVDSKYAKSTLAQVRKVFGKASAKPV